MVFSMAEEKGSRKLVERPPDKYFPRYIDRFELIRAGRHGTKLYSLDGVYYVDEGRRDRRFRRTQFFSFAAASERFAELQEEMAEAVG